VSELRSVRKVNIASGQVSTLAGSADFDGDADGAGPDARFFVPRGITTDGRSVYLVDSYNNTVRKIDIRTGIVSTFAGTVGANGTEDGVGPAARFNLPGDVTTDGENLYVTEPYSHTVRRIVISTREVTTIAGTPGVAGVADGTGANARFDSPYGIATDGKHLYVTTPHQVRRITISSGTVTTLAWQANGLTSTQFQTPIGITTDGSNLYLTESNRTVRKLSLVDGRITTVAGSPVQLGATDGLGAVALFNTPIGITTDGRSLYVADTQNHTIRRID
jgi:sugar lactone lactonase YvrE